MQINEFYLVEETIISELNRSENTSSNNSLVQDLTTRNLELNLKAEQLKNELPEEVISLLEKYKQNLENQEILNQILSIDEEMNILNSMLNLNLNNKIQ